MVITFYYTNHFVYKVSQTIRDCGGHQMFKHHTNITETKHPQRDQSEQHKSCWSEQKQMFFRFQSSEQHSSFIFCTEHMNITTVLKWFVINSRWTAGCNSSFSWQKQTLQASLITDLSLMRNHQTFTAPVWSWMRRIKWKKTVVWRIIIHLQVLMVLKSWGILGVEAWWTRASLMPCSARWRRLLPESHKTHNTTSSLYWHTNWITICDHDNRSSTTDQSKEH